MNELFEIIENEKQKKNGKKSLRISLNVRIGDWEKPHPVSDDCFSLNQFESEIRKIKDNLDRVFEKAKNFYQEPIQHIVGEIHPDMAPHEIWTILNHVEDENTFVESFNRLGHTNRRELAEYVLVKCNIFSGNGAVFSSRYNRKLELLE